MKNLTIRDMRENPGDSAFLIDDGKTSILYDSGFAFTGYAVAENIRAALGERSLDYIFLTHSHYDHALGSAYAKRVFPNVTVVAAEYAAKIFQKANDIRGEEAVISAADSKVKVLLIPTNEELMIAMDTMNIVK